VWAVAAASVAFTVYTPVYATLTAACTIFLYISYVLPTALGLFAHGRTWREMGPWHLGSLFKPAAAVSVLFTAFLIVIGVQPPNDKNLYVVAGAVLLGAVVWFGWERRRFPGPPALRTGGKAGSETGSP
jgi:amino acid transporter